MTLQDLYDQLVDYFPPSMQKDLKTTVRVLAQALQCSTPAQCPSDRYTQPLPTLYQLIEAFLNAQSKSTHTIRNTKNQVSRLFRLAEEQHLFSPPPAPLTPRHTLDAKPSRSRLVERNNKTYLGYPHWPHELQDAFTAFTKWATMPVVSGRDATLKKRTITVQNYKNRFESYFGFLAHVAHETPTFEHLFDIDRITRYTHWHINELHGKTTWAIHQFLIQLGALTRQYRPLPTVNVQILALKKTLPTPTPGHKKEEAWVSLKTLQHIGRTLWPTKQPSETRGTGARLASYAGLSLMLQLWTYRPYRQRNMREMLLGENLYKDADGKWWITFRGEQMKIAVKRGQANIFSLPFPPALVPVLEDYLRLWRPVLVAKMSQPEQEQHVFLTTHGSLWNVHTLHHFAGNTVYRFTGQPWHPHMIRTVWATEWIQKTHGDFYTAAVMLNDRLETVIAKYTHLLDENVAEKADHLLEERNGQGK